MQEGNEEDCQWEEDASRIAEEASNDKVICKTCMFTRARVLAGEHSPAPKALKAKIFQLAMGALAAGKAASAKPLRALGSTSQQRKHPEQALIFALGAFLAGERSPASILALAMRTILEVDITDDEEDSEQLDNSGSMLILDFSE
ncbi:MAG: hypothetical protein NXY57DRAFT_1042870 [Lentinula lateritia]|nr:MAG: hypothetical protein NXY57DRAFT_1042870 [Lentinula lateritia]